jgi:hypothetical protein
VSGIFKPHTEILPPAQRRLWPELKPAARLGLVLYGGTAIALRLGHRPSADFDFFSEKPLDTAVLRSHFPFMVQSTVLQDESNALSVIVPYGDEEHTHVKVSFFGAIGFGRVGKPDLTEDGVVQVASLADLMATKVKVVLQRAEAKDYRDIAAMIQAGVSLNAGLSAARAMFGTAFQPSESLKALVYFADGDLPALSEEEKKILVNAVKAVGNLREVEVVAKELGFSSKA